MNRLTIGLVAMLLTLNLSSQCYPDRHSTSLKDGWISCNVKSSPNTSRSNSHWIQYDFGSSQTIDAIKLWNSNLPDFEDVAVRELAIDISQDGENWTELGIYTLSNHKADVLYQGEEIEGFDPFSARSVLFTALTSYGSQCVGFAEVKFSLSNTSTNVEELVQWDYSIYPNPSVDFVNIDIVEDNFGVEYYEILNLKGQILIRQTERSSSFSVDVSGFIEGAYFIKIVGDQGNVITEKIQVFNP